MPDERTLRTAAAGAESGADWVLLTAPDTVCYASGFVVPIETGPWPFAGGPAAALVSPEGQCGLVVINIEEPAARAGYADIVHAYEGFTATTQPAWLANYLGAVMGLVAEMGAGGTFAVEPGFLPAALAERLDGATVDVGPALARMRAVKTARELELLRAAADVASVGQRAALAATRAGRTELDAFGEIRAAMEVAAGGRLPLTGDYISGVERTAACEGWPNARVMEAGDPVICDLSPRVAGYWGDSCNTLAIGDPDQGFMELYEVAERAIAQAEASVRPGVSAGVVAREVTDVIAASGFDNPLHIGHGTGTGFHEFPRIVLEEEALLEPGMVLMMEPGAYHPARGGVRLEHMFEVTETGNRILTDFELRVG